MEDCPLSIVRRDGGRKFNGAEKGQATYYRLNQIDIFSWNPKIRHILSSIKIWAFQFFSKMGLAPRCLAGQFMRHLKSLCEKKKGQTSKSAGLSARFCFRSNSTPNSVTRRRRRSNYLVPLETDNPARRVSLPFWKMR